VTFIGLDWVPNFEKTRWFLVLRLKRPGGNDLNRLLDICNGIVEEYGQPPLYASQKATNLQSKDDGRPVKRVCNEKNLMASMNDKVEMQDFSSAFHVSIGWTLEQPTMEAVEAIKAISNGGLFQGVRRICFKVEEIKAKVGNVVTSIFLPLKTTKINGLFGF
jgi:hypothetical protein